MLWGALELSRSKLAATIDFAAFVVFGWVVEASVKWAVSWVVGHWALTERQECSCFVLTACL